MWVVVLLILLWFILHTDSECLYVGPYTNVYYFFSPSCSYCQAMMPEWQKFDANVIETIHTEKIDITNPANADDVAKYGVTTVPFIIKINNSNVEVYHGERTADALNEWAMS